MPDTSVILLAAGLSRRMGAENKLLLPVNGRPMVRHVVDQYIEALDGEVLVVLGHQSEEIASTLKGTTARTVFNPLFPQGQATSVAAGLRAAFDANTFVIGLTTVQLMTKLVDQRLTTRFDIRQGIVAVYFRLTRAELV